MLTLISRGEHIQLDPIVPGQALQRVEASLGEVAGSGLDYGDHSWVRDRDC